MPIFAMNPTVEQAWRERISAIREIAAEIPARVNRLGADHEQLAIVSLRTERVAGAFFGLEQYWSGWLPITFGWRDLVDLLDALDNPPMPSFDASPKVKEAVSRNEIAFCRSCASDLARLIEHANSRYQDWENGDDEKLNSIEESHDELRDLIMAEPVPDGILRATPSMLQDVWA